MGGSNSTPNTSAQRRLLFMLSLTSLFFLIEITVGYITNSMALVADSFHMLSDVIALVIAYVSVRISPKKWSKNTFGWARAEVLGALVNAVFLVALCFSILVESIKRFYKPETIHDAPLIMGVGVAGLLVNVIGLFLFKDGGGAHGHSHGGGGGHGHGHNHSGHTHSGHGHSHSNGNGIDHHPLSIGDSREPSPAPMTPSPEPMSDSDKGVKPLVSSSAQMNMRGVFLHVLADALGSVIVCLSAAIIIWWDSFEYKEYVDPSLSVFMVLLISFSTWGLLVESAMILLQTVPTHIQVDSLEKKLLQEIDGVLAVHEFHVWQLAGDRIIASAHIRCHSLDDYMEIAEKIKEFFHNEGIHSTTIQPEFVHPSADTLLGSGDDKSSDCVLDCPKKSAGENCSAQTCCGPQQQGSPKSTRSHPNASPAGSNGDLTGGVAMSSSLPKQNHLTGSSESVASTEFVEVITSGDNVLNTKTPEDMV